MGKMERSPPQSPFTVKRKPTSPLKRDESQNKVIITDRQDNSSKLTLEQKVELVFDKLVEWGPLIKKLEDINCVPEISVKLDQVDRDLERVKKELIASNVIIAGAAEAEKETYAELTQTVEKVLGALKIGEVDYSQVRRLGRPQTGKTRSIQVKLVRQKDKIRILQAKMNLKATKDMANIYINPELTQLEKAREVLLRETATDWKKTNKGIKFFIRGGLLTVIRGDGSKTFHKVNSDGLVEDIIH